MYDMDAPKGQDHHTCGVCDTPSRGVSVCDLVRQGVSPWLKPRCQGDEEMV